MTAPPPGRAEDATPASWRAIAALTVVGGLLAGHRLATGSGAVLPVALGVAFVAGTVVPVGIASRRPPVVPGGMPDEAAGASTTAIPAITFSVLVAGRDEAAVLPQLVRDVAAQDWRLPDGSPGFELLVIDDRSADGTGAAVLDAARTAGIEAVARLIRREGSDLADGKGAALTAAQPGVCRGDYVVVLDADARIGPGFLRALAGYATLGVEALTARRRILGAERSMLAQLQADEQNLDGALQRGRWALGGCSEFRGNGIVIRRDRLAALGGWRSAALTEDLDLSSRLAAQTGLTVAWALEAEVWEEPVRTWSGLWRQRLRWAEGAVRRLLEHAPAVLGSRRLGRIARADFAIYAGQLLAPPIILGATIGARRKPAAAAALLGAYLAVGGGLTWDALRWELDAAGRPPAPAERLRRSIRAALFNAIWLGAVPLALLRLATRSGRVRYDKMPHEGSAGVPDRR